MEYNVLKNRQTENMEKPYKMSHDSIGIKHYTNLEYRGIYGIIYNKTW